MLYVLIGPGGVGKNQLMKEVLPQVDNLKQLATATTRDIRKDEQEGREHQFVSIEQFKTMIANNELVEYQEVHPDKFYGVPRQTMVDAIEAREDLIADLDVYGAEAIQKEFPDHSTLIYILPPAPNTIIDRLINRGASEKDFQDRVNRMPMEMLYAPMADYVIVNDQFETAVGELLSLIYAVRENTSYNEVAISIQGQLTLLTSDDKSNNSCFRQAVHRGTTTQESIMQLGQAHFGAAFDSFAVEYANTDGSFPFHCTYDADQRRYELTYFFTATVPEGVALPEGCNR